MENNLTEEQKSLICEWLNKQRNSSLVFSDFLKHHNLLPTPKFEVGKVYKSKIQNDSTVFVTSFGYDGTIVNGYGWDNGKWSNDIHIPNDERLIEIPQEEWIEVLKKEGDKYIGKTVKCLYDDRNYVVRKFSSVTKTGNLYYCTEENTNVCLMKDGVWATVVSDENLDKISELQMKLDKLQEEINQLKK